MQSFKCHQAKSPLNNTHGCASSMNSPEFGIQIANTSTAYDQLPYDAVQCDLFVAQRLTKLPDERLRRELENSIQAAILDAERESF